SVLPLKVERARLFARVQAPSRRFSVAGHADGRPVPLHAVESPLDPVRLEIVEERFLRLDEQGGLHLHVAVSDPVGGGGPGAPPENIKWAVAALERGVGGGTWAER